MPQQCHWYCFGDSTVNFKHISLCSIAFIVDFEQVVVGRIWETIVSDKFIFSIYGKTLSYSAGEICHTAILFLCSLNIMGRGVWSSYFWHPQFETLLIPFVYCNLETNQKGCNQLFSRLLLFYLYTKIIAWSIVLISDKSPVDIKHFATI